MFDVWLWFFDDGTGSDHLKMVQIAPKHVAVLTLQRYLLYWCALCWLNDKSISEMRGVDTFRDSVTPLRCIFSDSALYMLLWQEKRTESIWSQCGQQNVWNCQHRASGNALSLLAKQMHFSAHSQNATQQHHRDPVQKMHQNVECLWMESQHTTLINWW
jgi:hypothetical protein